jgi:sec-independent protein translocase protein TatB
MNPLSSVGTGELILILVLALIFLGPERLPEIARNVGKAIRQFRMTLQNMSSEFGEELATMQEATRDIQEGMQAVRDVRNLSQTLVSSAAAPLVEAVEEVKEAVDTMSGSTMAQVEEAKKTIGQVSTLAQTQVEELKETLAATPAPTGDQTTDPTPEREAMPAESESPPSPDQDSSQISDEPRVVIEDDQV